MPPHEWSSTQYVEDWTSHDSHDSKEALLSVPWRISAELVRDDRTTIDHVVDLGSGPGGFLAVMLATFPAATGSWIDSSEPMLERAQQRLAPIADRVTFVVADAGDPGLALPEADVITSSRMIHHFAPARAQALYRAVHDALRPGGWFCNLDHFAAPDDFEARYRRIKPSLTGRERRTKQGHSHEAPLSLVADHLTWLTDAGFVSADEPWRTLWTALTVARRA